jgi:arylsulfatase A-like enzyme
MCPIKALAIASLGLALVGGGSACSDGNSRPNILIIVTDDQRDGLSAMPETTRLFRRQGVRLKLGYVTDPLCCPSRASIMTGRYPHNTGVRSDTPHPEYGVLGATALDSSTTIQRYLHDDGYTTALVGKYLNQWDFSDAPPFFDTFTMVHKQSDYFHNLVSSGELGQAPDVHLSETYNTTLILRRTLDFLDAHEDASQPFFLYVAPEAPHYPFTPEPRYETDTFGKWKGNPAVFEADRSDKPEYVRMHHATLRSGRSIRTKQFRTLESVDDLVEAIFAQLRSTGQADNTLAFFISDNGYLWGEHGLLRKSHPYRPDVQVPFFARWPAGPLEPGTTDARRASNVDIAPTVMDAVGLTVPSGQPPMDGRSLLQPWVRQRQLTEHWCTTHGCLFWAAEETRTYHYIEYYDGPDVDAANVVFREYYDLKTDPFELDNLLGDSDPGNDPDVKAVAAQLARDRKCSAADCP